MSGAARGLHDQIFHAERRGVPHVGENPLMPRAASQAIELLSLDAPHRHALLLRQTERRPHPLVGAQRHEEPGHASGAQRFDDRR